MPIPLSRSTAGHRVYQNIPLTNLNHPSRNGASEYRLRRYKWRTFLNISGPLLVLGYYAFVCFYFLANPPLNNIVPVSQVDGRWIFYGWIIISIFILDWARSGLANIEATALMHSSFAPESAMELMWHTESNWNNALWWFRALGNIARYYFSTLRRRSNHFSRPGGLWWLLMAVTLLLFVAVPLSGLTMEITDAYIHDTKKVLILGPVSDNFNYQRFTNIPNQVRASWRSGRATTPSDSSILYAPEGFSDVSGTYYQDQIFPDTENPMIRVFAGPAVNEVVVGKAWGLSANISCRAIPKGNLRLFDVHGYNDYTVNDVLRQADAVRWINETGVYNYKSAYSLMVASDGTTYGDPPYCTKSNHDYQTLDGLTRPRTDITTGVLEAYLWQGLLPPNRDATLDQLLDADLNSTLVTRLDEIDTGQYGASKIPIVGFGVHCDVTSAVGTADVDPARRTYSSFQRGSSLSLGTDQMAYPVQVQAFRAIAEYNQTTYTLQVRDPTQSDSSWVAAHFALGLLPYSKNTTDAVELGYLETNVTFPALTPTNLTNAMYKLLGESIIALMGPGAHNASYGDLYGLKSVKYIKPGIISWRPVLALLSLWTLLFLAGSVWMAFHRRWASSLTGFEFFKFGAQYPLEVNSFSSTTFQQCIPLRNIPGLVGSLSGNAVDCEEGFIGLSKRVARMDGTFVYDRAKSGKDP